MAKLKTEISSKKRKDRAEEVISVERAAKKMKRDKEKKAKRDKKPKLDATEGPQEFTLVHASMVISLPPVFAANPLKGVGEMLDSLVMRCVCLSRRVSIAFKWLVLDIFQRYEAWSSPIPASISYDLRPRFKQTRRLQSVMLALTPWSGILK